MYNWYVIQTKPGQTDRAQIELENQGFDTYLPKMPVDVIKRGKRTVEDKPLFPGYLFIYLSELESNWRPIRSTRGVAKLVSFGSQPAIMPADAVMAIRRQLGDKAPLQSLHSDQPVEITEGPFKDLNAIFVEYDGEKRAFVLLELLGRWQRLSIDLENIRN